MYINKNFNTLLPVALICLASCGESKPQQTDNTGTAVTTPATPISDLFWLAGNWQMATTEGIIYEKWAIAADSSISGTSGFISGNDTMLSETIALQMNGDTIMYIPTVKNQNNGMPVPFKLTKAEADSFVFENPKHDFPDKITYHKLSDTVLVARISGVPNGKYRFETFEMKKIR